MLIEGSNNPGNRVHVSDDGRLQTRAVTITEQAQKSLLGDAYNINTGEMTLTDDLQTPIFYFKNETENDSLIIPRVFFVFLESTGGAGKARACIKANITGGTILSAPDLAPTNFNFGSSKIPGTTLKLGASGLTEVGGSVGPEFLFTSDNQRQTVPFEAIILPRGASMTVTFTPPVGNTSMVLEAGANFYIDGDFL
jgi:hypothetical protein